METIASRLKSARLARGWTQGQLATAAEVSQGTIGNIEAGHRQARASLVKIAKALDLSYDWLADGIEPKTLARSVGERPAIYLIDNPEFPAVRRVKLKLEAGITGFSIEMDPEDGPPIVFRKEWFDSRGFKPAKLIALRVRGSSMEPVLFEGDTVVVNTEQTTPKDGAVFAINYEGEMVVKRMVRDASQWWLCSDNPDQARFPRKLANGSSIVIGEIVHRQSERIQGFFNALVCLNSRTGAPPW